MRKSVILFLCTSLLSVPYQANALSDQKILNILRGERQVNCHTVKEAVANYDESKSLQKQFINGDESLYEDFRGSFGKGLNHFNNGYIDPAAFKSLVYPLQTANYNLFNQIQLGFGRPLVNPQGCFSYSLASNDGWINIMRAAPAFASAETAGEMVELYWTALVRDVPFNEYNTDSTVAMAVADLNTLSDFRGPKDNGQVTPGTFLRGNTEGDLIGPYISQFLYHTVPFGQLELEPFLQVPTPASSDANDFNTTFTDWFTVINGGVTGKSTTYEPAKTFIRNARDLAEYVHSDFPGQAAFFSLLILNSYGPTALDPDNPYRDNPTQEGFVSYGFAHALELVEEAIEEGLKAAWYQKWQVNRRCRPEEFGFYVVEQKGGTELGIHPDLINSNALVQIDNSFGSFFLPGAYPEGSPTHPSYPAGHAVLMGAAVTVLKAFFDEEFTIINPVQPNLMNDGLDPYGGTLTVGNELNKLAANISLGRDHAGVHYRSDGIEGLKLGEKVAIDILNNQSYLFNENFPGFTLTKFDGTKVAVGRKRTAL